MTLSLESKFHHWNVTGMQYAFAKYVLLGNYLLTMYVSWDPGGLINENKQIL